MLGSLRSNRSEAPAPSNPSFLSVFQFWYRFQFEPRVAGDFGFVKAEVETISSTGCVECFDIHVNFGDAGDGAFSFSADGPGPTARRGRVVRGQAFRGKRALNFAKEWAQDRYALDEDCAGDFRGVPDI